MENTKSEKSLKNSIDRIIVTKTSLIEVEYALSLLVEKTKINNKTDDCSLKCSGEASAEPTDLIELLNEQNSDMTFTINRIFEKILYLNNFIG